MTPTAPDPTPGKLPTPAKSPAIAFIGQGVTLFRCLNHRMSRYFPDTPSLEGGRVKVDIHVNFRIFDTYTIHAFNTFGIKS
jgi:hypothetical protein